MAFIMLFMGALSTGAVKVHTIGDSTMANYAEDRVTRGWAQFLQQFFGVDVTVNNRAKPGSSSKSFYREEGMWPSVKKQLEQGDYVLIQFAHNDEKTGGTDGDSLKAYYERIGDAAKAASTDYRGTTPFDTYKMYLRKYVEESRAAGCTPVLVSPICRMYFSGNTIRRNGQHDLGDSFSELTTDGLKEKQSVAKDNHKMDYVYAMKQVADELDVPFIDLTAATRELYLSYGDARCHELLSDGDGSTHLNTTGATLIARKAAELLKKAGILADKIQVQADISVSPQQADLGQAYKGQKLSKEFSLSGFSLTPESGSVSVSASQGILLSTDKTNWSSTLTLPYADGTLIKSFFAQVSLDAAGTISGTITVASAAKTIEIPVKAEAVSLEGGTEVKAYWRLEKDDNYTLQGPAIVIPQSMQGMHVQRYANPNKNTTWPEGTGFDASRKTQRNLIDGDVWPDGEIDEVSTRFIQFGITPAKGTTLKVDSIGLYLCGCGGNGMRCHVNYSTKPGFADDVNFYAPEKLPANQMQAVSVQPVISLAEGDTLRVRVYPWYSGSATGKTICLSDVTIHGKAFDDEATGISSLKDKKDAATTQAWYNLQGQRVGEPGKGLYIRGNKKYIFK